MAWGVRAGNTSFWKADASSGAGCAVRTTFTATSSHPCIRALYTVPLPPSPMRIFFPWPERAILISSLPHSTPWICRGGSHTTQACVVWCLASMQGHKGMRVSITAGSVAGAEVAGVAGGGGPRTAR